jgi:GPH family glycoside/pentoside/hexuronide:cation symporter
VNAERLSVPRMLSYGAVFMPISLVGLPLVVWIPTVYAELGVPLAAIGTIFLVSRLSDAVTDPLIGLASDRARTRFGRRKPFMLAGTPLFMLAAYMLFVPPPDPTWVYMLVWISILFLAATIVDLPYLAWGAEISRDYTERTRVAGVREQFHFVGTLSTVSVPFGLKLVLGITALTVVLKWIGWLFLVLLPLTVIVAVWFVPERRPEERKGAELSVSERWMIIARNGPFLRLIFCYTVSIFGSAMTGALSYLFVKHVVGAADQYPLYLLVYFGSSVAAVPLWRRLADRIDKHRASIVAIVWYAFFASFIPFISAGSFGLYLVVMSLKGAGVAALLFLPYSMAADAIDLDTLESGEERTGIYFAVWGMVRKGSYALGGAAAFWALAWVDFNVQLDPTLSEAAGGNTDAARMLLACLYSIVPGLFWFLSVPFLWNYPLTEARQQEIRALIDARD